MSRTGRDPARIKRLFEPNALVKLAGVGVQVDQAGRQRDAEEPARKGAGEQVGAGKRMAQLRPRGDCLGHEGVGSEAATTPGGE